MKTKILAVVIFIVTVTLTSVNTFCLDRSIGEIISRVESLEISENNTEEAFAIASSINELYESQQTYISLSVSHSDLTDIEAALVELLGRLKVGNAEEAEVTKSRLVDALKHLRRLSGVNIDSVI